MMASQPAAGVPTQETVGVIAATGEESDHIIQKGNTVGSPMLVIQASATEASIAHETQEMEEISLGENSDSDRSLFEKVVPVTEMNGVETMDSDRKHKTPGSGDPVKSESQHDVILEPGSSEEEEGQADTLPVSTDAITGNSNGESDITPQVVERTELDEKLALLTKLKLGPSAMARASELAASSTPPTPERTGAVIRLTRQMSRVSTSSGTMSPRLELRAAKEVQELQEKVKFMEEELRRKSAMIETLSLNHKERENDLLQKIECLELANEQLLQGGNDSSIQLQMELTRLQRQNSVLQLRERELQFQINTQEMIKQRPSTMAVLANPVEQLEAKVAVLESKLLEAVEVSNMYKAQLHEAFSRQKSAQSAALLNLGDAEELQKLRKRVKEQDAEIGDLQDRYFMISVRLAETAAQKEELLSKLKRMQMPR